jgi:FkbM family methyltransferase
MKNKERYVFDFFKKTNSLDYYSASSNKLKYLFKIVKKIFFKYYFYLAKNRDVKFLGTPYGGWYFSDKNLPNQMMVVSAGVGEDISFDIELMNNFQAKLFLIDPTPRAISYIQKIINNLGNEKTMSYDESSGYQPIESYDLSNIKLDDLIFIKKALYNKSQKTIKFYAPLNKKFVSHSISNFQNSFSKDTDFIEVKTIMLKDIVFENNIGEIDLLKLDIEGAENQVIPNILRDKIFPKQILVEFDELSTRFIKPYLKAMFIFTYLKMNNYTLVKTEDFPNFLFLRE